MLSAYTRKQLLGGLSGNDPLGAGVRRSFHSERSGDVAVVLKPYHLFTFPFLTGTTHGTAHSYDTHVPLLVYGPSVLTGVHEEAVTPESTAAILAHGLGIKPPAQAKARVPEKLFTSP